MFRARVLADIENWTSTAAPGRRSGEHLQHGFWCVSQAGEQEVPLEGWLAGTLAADDHFDDPGAAGPGPGDEISSFFGPEGPGGLAPVTVL